MTNVDLDCHSTPAAVAKLGVDTIAGADAAALGAAVAALADPARAGTWEAA